VTTELLDLARAGDEKAFAQLTDPHRHELQVHCYRILGSVQDAEDALQEALLAAWLGLRDFEGRSSIRTWLYQIATNRCLNARRTSSRQPQMDAPLFRLPLPEPTRTNDVVWLEPYPNTLLDDMADVTTGPEARYEAREAISLAFVTALQELHPRQRAALVLRDVLGFRSKEAAQILDTTEESISSALKRARATLERRSRTPTAHEPPPQPDSPAERDLVERLTVAYQENDLDGIVALLSDDVWLRMPPVPLEYQGRDLASQFLAVAAFLPGRIFRLVHTRANQQPAFGVYVKDPDCEMFHANGLMVLTLAGSRISAMTRFDNSVLPWFGMPRSLDLGRSGLSDAHYGIAEER
jgi:RNA polymerase sigma-70 factor (TIGR02960 family)